MLYTFIYVLQIHDEIALLSYKYNLIQRDCQEKNIKINYLISGIAVNTQWCVRGKLTSQA